MSTAQLQRPVDAIAIGTSTGGVEALVRVLPALPAATRASVFVVLHLPRDRASLLVEIFEPLCRLPVREVYDKDPVLAGTIYFAPPGYHLLLDEGPQFALSMDAPVEFSRPSVDVLLETAALAYGERLLALILTGAGSDGAAGLAAVRSAGGMTVVQDPAEARMPHMPQAALECGAADLVLTLDDIMTLFQTLPLAECA